MEKKTKVISRNKKASFDYFLEEILEAGIQLEGCEVKSIRSGNCSIKEAFVTIENGECFIKQMNIKPYDKEYNFNKVDSNRVRKLLLHKKEIMHMLGKVSEKGYTLIPTAVKIVGQYVKIDVAIAKGKHNYDKRAVLKEKDANRNINRALKEM